MGSQKMDIHRAATRSTTLTTPYRQITFPRWLQFEGGREGGRKERRERMGEIKCEIEKNIYKLRETV